MKVLCRALMLMGVMVLLPQVASAAETVARATFVSGSVQARSSSGATRTLVRGGELHSGDTIVTGPGGSAQLIFADNSRVAVRASTEFAIDEFRMGNDEGFVLRLTRGALRSITGLIGHRNKGNFSLRTPVATIGIRGTDFEAVHVPEGGSAFGGGTIDPGTYNKVYAGGTQLVSSAGKIDLNINEVGFIGIGGKTGAGPVKIDQLPPGIIKVINAAPIISKTDAAPADDGARAPGTSEAKTSTEAATADGSAPTPQIDSKSVTTTKLPTTTLNSTTIRTLDTTTLSPTTTTLSPTTTTLSPTTTTLSPTTTTLSPTTTTLSPTTTTLSPATTTLSPATTTLSPTTTTLSPTTTTLSPATTTLSPATTTLSPATTTLSPATTTLSPSLDPTKLNNATLK